MDKILAYSYSRYRYYLTGKKPQNKFFILTKSRSGSTLLTDLLNCHPNIYCDTEILNISTHGKLFHPASFIEACSREYTLGPVNTYGFKFFIYHLTEDYQIAEPIRFLKQLTKRGWKCIFLERENIVLEAFSLYEAHMRKRYHLADSPEAKERGPITIDLDNFLKLLHRRMGYRKLEQELLQIFPPQLHLTYERDLLSQAAQQNTCSQVFRILGLPDKSISTQMKKINAQPMSVMVKNFQELKDALSGTPYEPYLS